VAHGDPAVNPKNFFAELKRRNVYKVAAVYVVVAWLLIQAASILFPTFEAPAWVMKTFVALILLGFPIALILAWAFELTPEGIKRAEDVDLGESIATKTGHKLTIIIIAIVVLALSLLVFQLTPPHPAVSVAKPPAVPNDKSVAVLPFANLSRDPDNAYFAAGIQDEIITRLAKITELKVISCTSTQRFKSAPDDLPAIAKQLGVANILEGSVQRTTDQLRVNVQLVEAATDAHLWADTFDRKLTDIFKIESEIAKTVAETLQAKLSASEQHAIAARPTENTEAHQLYLKGRFFWDKRTSENLTKSIDYFNQAVAADPNHINSFMNIRVADIQACYELWKSRGAEFITEPIPKYGEIRCYIRDPDGYIIEVGQSTELKYG
jgi:TolB-like protein